MKNNSSWTDFKLVIFGWKERRVKSNRELQLNSLLQFSKSLPYLKYLLFYSSDKVKQ